MKFANLQNTNDKNFRRVTGVKRSTFTKMVEVITLAERVKKAKGGRPNSLSVEDRILMALEYLREYRTYLHIATSYGLSESAAFQCIRWIENTFISNKEFRLPGKKALLKSDHEFEVILMDVAESPIERPKKNNANSTQAKRKNIR